MLEEQLEKSRQAEANAEKDIHRIQTAINAVEHAEGEEEAKTKPEAAAEGNDALIANFIKSAA